MGLVCRSIDDVYENCKSVNYSSYHDIIFRFPLGWHKHYVSKYIIIIQY